MQNFIYHNTAKIIFGQNQISAIEHEIAADKRVMISE